VLLNFVVVNKIARHHHAWPFDSSEEGTVLRRCSPLLVGEGGDTTLEKIFIPPQLLQDKPIELFWAITILRDLLELL
jgi:hypothetical protein